MNKKKILFLITNLGHGGAERVLINLVNHMDQEKFDITVQTLFDVGIYQDHIKNGIRYIGGYKRYPRGNTVIMKLFSPKRLYKHFIKEDYDVIISYLEGPTARVVSGCTNKKTKLISWIHIEQETLDYASKSFRSRKEAINCYKKFNKIICVSEGIRKDFNNIFKFEKNIGVIYNTIESDKIKLKSLEKIEDVNFNSKEINVISVAKLMKTKGYDRLINVTKRLIDEGYPLHVYIVGKGEEKGSLEKQVSHLGLNKNWTFVGFTSNPYKYVRGADIYICSSRREGFSTAVTEALIVGTPVVSTNCSGAYELLGEENEYGIVTENNEEALYQGIKTMIDGDNLTYYRKKAEERGKEFNADNTTKEVEKMIQEVLES